MSEHTDKDLEIKDLPAEEELTAEEKERLAGAGRFRPSFEALELREVMTVAPIAPLALEPPPVQAGQPGYIAPMPTTGYIVEMPSTNSGLVAAAADEVALPDAVQFNGVSNASAALPVGNGEYMFIADDKSPSILLFNARTGTVVSAFDTNKVTPGGVWDIEGVASVKNQNGEIIAYWTTSGGADNDSNDIIFATRLTGDGANAKLEYIGKVTSMREAIKAYGEAHSDFKVTDGTAEKSLDQAMAEAGKGSDFKGWYNIEGIVVKPGSTMAYIAMRAPLVKDGTTYRALLIPVTNFTNLFPEAAGGSARETKPQIGDPVLLDGLGGRGIRDIVYSTQWDRFVILGGDSFKGSKSSEVYVWDGVVNGGHGTAIMLSSGRGFVAPGKEALPDWERDKWMSLEAIGPITGNLEDGTGRIFVIADDGGTSHGKKASPENRYFTARNFEVPPMSEWPA